MIEPTTWLFSELVLSITADMRSERLARLARLGQHVEERKADLLILPHHHAAHFSNRVEKGAKCQHDAARKVHRFHKQDQTACGEKQPTSNALCFKLARLTPANCFILRCAADSPPRVGSATCNPTMGFILRAAPASRSGGEGV